MGEHHRVYQADALGDRHRDQVGDRRADAAPEQYRRRRRDGDLKPLIQPQCEQRLHQKPGAERVHPEQRREAVDEPLRLPERLLLGRMCRLDCR